MPDFSLFDPRIRCSWVAGVVAAWVAYVRADLLVMAGVERVEGRKVFIHLEVRDSPPEVCHWPAAVRDGEAQGLAGASKGDGEEKSHHTQLRNGRGGGGGGGDGTVYATGSALFIVLAKD